MKFNVQDMLKQAQQMQAEMEKVKKEINEKEVTSDAGGGMVTVKMNGGGELLSIKIAKEIVNPDDIEMLEDLVIAAINKAKKEADDMAQQEMGKINNMLPNIPGLNLGM